MSTHRGAALAGRLGADEGGATAVEFALVAIPFLAVIFAIFETAVVFAAGEILQTSVADASRTIMTGKAGSLDKAGFKAKICERMSSLFDCKGKLAIDVRTLKTMAGAGRANPYVDGKYDTSGWKYEPGGSGSVVVVTAAYPWPTFTHIGGFSLAEGESNQLVLTGTAVFKSETY